MRDDHDVVQSGIVDVGNHRGNPLGDGGGLQLPGLAAPTGHVNREHLQLWCLPVDFIDGELPAVGDEPAAVDED